ncbi:hypothetical protein [Pasteurella bettyae]|uniref:DUF8095 domain-containing protein n=1 Tax=Pasteurella bettyae CCUG 2042 TaxID=1095749 RepID=I3D7W6_9PAST|nr:hypothetical protein [Pasteurella bettyae]EIJ67809.1 hypothetical protein HMPREF1052_0505 [Pasteurella bettyae CCUG 2042]SUB22088.1 lipoprotein-2 [Pasteurella bettyae]
MNKLLVILSLILLNACSSGTKGNSDFQWLGYEDIDNQLHQVAFMKRAYASEQKGTSKLASGEALMKVKEGGFDSYITLGDIYNLYDANGQVMNVILAIPELKKSFNPHLPQDRVSLAKAKTIDFYEFGKSRVGHTQFKAKNGMCADLQTKAGVNLNLATTYYLSAKGNDYFATLIAANVSKKTKKLVGLNYTPKFNIADQKILSQVKSEEAKQGKAVAQRNVLEKITVLDNVICL